MDVHELIAKVANELKVKGFDGKFECYADNGKMYEMYVSKDGKFKVSPIEGRNYMRHDGYRVEAWVVDRHNGAEENISVDISIYEYEYSSGKRIAKERMGNKIKLSFQTK